MWQSHIAYEAWRHSCYCYTTHLYYGYFFILSIPYLKWLLSSMNQLVPLELGTLHKCLSTFGTHMDPGPMGVQVLPHGSIVPEQLVTALARA